MSTIPPLNGLRAFEVSGRHLNFRSAAEELGVTQGAVAQQVRQLEKFLDLSLFERLPKGLAFTAAGRGYHTRVSKAFAELRAASNALRPDVGKIRISVTPTFAAKWLIPNLPDFSKRHPGIDLGILATEKVSSFYSDGIDLAIRQGNPPFGASLSATLLFRQELVAIAAPALLENHANQSPHALLSVLPKIHDTHDHWPAFLRSLNTEDQSQGGLRLSQTALAVDAALSGQGIALVSRFLAQADIAAGKLVQLVPETLFMDQDFYLLSPRGGSNLAAKEAAINWLVERSSGRVAE